MCAFFCYSLLRETDTKSAFADTASFSEIDYPYFHFTTLVHIPQPIISIPLTAGLALFSVELCVYYVCIRVRKIRRNRIFLIRHILSFPSAVCVYWI